MIPAPLALGLQQVREVGWTCLRSPVRKPVHELLSSVAAQLDGVAAHHQRSSFEVLQPHISNHAPRNSQSSRFGLGDFPLHTDTACWPVPARYVLLGALAPASAGGATIVKAIYPLLTDELQNLARSALVAVRNGRMSFYARLLDPIIGSFRWDPNCLRPVNAAAKEFFPIFETVLAQHPAQAIRWQEGLVLIIDNWRVLHGRSAITIGADQRRIARLYAGNP
jgi:alpha-ketoglutarate-dependent taurine dioxygenase